jgi:hypothetical protein
MRDGIDAGEPHCPEVNAVDLGDPVPNPLRDSFRDARGIARRAWSSMLSRRRVERWRTVRRATATRRRRIASRCSVARTLSLRRVSWRFSALSSSAARRTVSGSGMVTIMGTPLNA